MSNKVNRKMEKSRSLSRQNYIVMICAVMGIAVVSAAAVFVVRAFLTDYTNLRENVFASMTYTNIDIVEPNGKSYSVDLSFNGTAYTSHDGKISDKQAVIRNLPGSDKKPVYLRSKVIMTITDKDGIDITAKYSYGSSRVMIDPDCLYYLHGATTQNPNVGEEWTYCENDGYYYYNRILLPGESTMPLFRQMSSNGDYASDSWNKVKILNAAFLPDNAVVHVDILADAVQAVSSDTVKWTAADYYDPTEVTTAWGKTPTLPSKTGGSFTYYDPSYGLRTVPEGYDSVIPALLAEQYSIKCTW